MMLNEQQNTTYLIAIQNKTKYLMQEKVFFFNFNTKKTQEDTLDISLVPLRASM